MAKNTSIILGNHFDDFVGNQLNSGRYSSASEVVRAGLRLLEDQETKLKALQEALIAGEESGEPQSFDGDSFLKRMHDQHGD